MVNSFRKLLIRIGKVLPFVICFLALVNYTETLFALLTGDYLDWNGVVIPNTRFSFLVGNYFEYNIQMLVVLCITSIAIQTCVFNKLSCLYLGLNLYEKSWFVTHEYDNEIYYVVCVTNIVLCAFLCYKGFRIISKH